METQFCGGGFIQATQDGWIHVQFPVQHTHEKQWWHINRGGGGTLILAFLIPLTSYYLPFQSFALFQKVGGNTHLLAKSHIYMDQWLHASGKSSIPKEVTQDCWNLAKVWSTEQIIAIEPGVGRDVLLMYPFLVHTAGFTQPNHPLWIAFNMGVQWTQPVMFHKVPGSWHEEGIQNALQ